MTNKKMGIVILSMTMAILLSFTAVTYIVDPFFHYHKPYEWISYDFTEERYINDGITRNFEYNAIITGTSMTENFKTSECDEIFGVRSIKVPFSAGTFKEVNNSLSNAIERNPNIEIVIRCLDLYYFLYDKDQMNYDTYPEYLYDDNPFNDASYLLNKEVFLSYTVPSILHSIRQLPPTEMDNYASWNDLYDFGKQAVLENYTRSDSIQASTALTDTDKEIIRGTVAQNITALAKANPEIDFYYYLPPYSIIYWDTQRSNGNSQRLIEALHFATELILECENIHLYSFLSDYETVCNLDNYKDTIHYHEDINSKILRDMKSKEYLLTKENYNNHCSAPIYTDSTKTPLW